MVPPNFYASARKTSTADQENGQKEGKGFHKLNEESVASVRENLTADYQVVADHHSKKIMQLLEELDATEVEITRHL